MARERTDRRERDGGVSLNQAILIGSVAFLFGLFVGQALSDDREVSAGNGLHAGFGAAPELPREWRLEREAITFDHMFRNRQSAVD